jgi:tetratricopeptide (TPR) repeat protein
MQQSVKVESDRSNNRFPMRQTALIVFGVVAITVGLGIRKSRWARERMLKNLSVEQLSLAIRDQPDDALTFMYYGSALLAAGNNQEAEQAFKRAAKLEPKNEKAVLGTASSQYRLNKLDDAVVSFKAAIALDAKDKEAYLGLAQALYRQGYASHATEPLKKIIEMDPKSGPAWYFLGKLYGDSHETDQALDALKHAVQVDGTKGIYWRDLGQLERHYSRLTEAEADFKKSIHFSPNDMAAYLWLGQVYMQMGDDARLRGQAEQCFQTSIAHDPQMQEAYVGLGQLYQRSANYTAAIANYRKAVELDEGDDVALHYLGECLVRSGKTTEGQKLLSASIELGNAKRDIDYMQKRILAEPKQRDLRLRMARLYRKYENDRDALQQYAAYQNLGAEDPKVRAEMVQYEDQLIKKGILPPRPTVGGTGAPVPPGARQ